MSKSNHEDRIEAGTESLLAIWPQQFDGIRTGSNLLWAQLVATAAIEASDKVEVEGPVGYTGDFDFGDYRAFYLAITSTCGIDESVPVERAAEIIQEQMASSL